MRLPEPFGEWIQQLLNDEVPDEQAADCHHCVMCSAGENAKSSLYSYFNPATKCCTYIPEIPNFLVGNILKDSSLDATHGRKSIEQRIHQGVNVTPLGLGIPPDYALKYKNSLDAFGHSATMLCPHFSSDTGQCSIWQHRSAVCMSWYCKHDKGAKGREFWQTLNKLIQGIQYSLSLWCLQRLEFSPAALKALFRHLENEATLDRDSIDQQPNIKLLDELWQDWRGREQEFYQKCSQYIGELTWLDVQKICGPELTMYAQLLQHSFLQLTERTIPARLHTGTFQVLESNQQTIKVVTYSPLDPLELPLSTLSALALFNEYDVAHCLDNFSRISKVPINSSTLQTLIDFELLLETS